MQLAEIGWTASLGVALSDLDEPGLTPKRVVEEHKGRFRILGAEGESSAVVAGRLIHEAIRGIDFPVVGDWVAVEGATGGDLSRIRCVLPRRTALVRRAPDHSPSEEQILAANLDTVLLVTSLNREFNPRRLERYLALVWASGAQPVVVLNKSDLCHDVESFRTRAEAVAIGVPLVVTSGVTGDGLDGLEGHLGPGRTAALIGSSGVGKSTLVNRLLGREALVTRPIREDDARGRHTTSHRQLILLPRGGMLIDTPGLREVGLWDGESGVDSTFAEIEDLAAGCRFRDCRHGGEPGCAIQQAIDDGTLDPGRASSYRKLGRELAHQAIRQDETLRIEAKRRRKQLSRAIRRRRKLDGR